MMLILSDHEHKANILSQTENDSNRLSRLKSALRNLLLKKLKNSLIDTDHDELNTYLILDILRNWI